MNDNWREDCPGRAAGLYHAHWSDCNPNETHPGTDRSHAWTQCCHCEAYIVGSPRQEATEAEEFTMREAGVVPQPPIQHHDYVPTMVGLCLRCRTPLSSHPVAPVKVAPVPEEVHAPVEGHYPSIGAQGPLWGLGRGELTSRQKVRLIAWMGWSKWNEQQRDD